jgi:YbbR domain-containing protein
MIVFLRNLVVHDFWLKLFSLGLAFLIWYIVSPLAYRKDASAIESLANAGSEQTFAKIPVLIMSTAADVHDFKVSPDQVIVTVRGNAARLQELRSQDIRALVDLTGIEAAPRGSRLRIGVTTPAGITLVSIVPDDVQVIVPGKR